MLMGSIQSVLSTGLLPHLGTILAAVVCFFVGTQQLVGALKRWDTELGDLRRTIKDLEAEVATQKVVIATLEHALEVGPETL